MEPEGTDRRVEAVFETVRACVSGWVGYNAPNTSDHLRAHDAKTQALAALNELRDMLDERTEALKRIDYEDHYEDRIDWKEHTAAGFPAQDCFGCLARAALHSENTPATCPTCGSPEPAFRRSIGASEHECESRSPDKHQHYKTCPDPFHSENTAKQEGTPT